MSGVGPLEFRHQLLELRAWVRRLGGPIKRAFVVHGEAPALGAMANLLREEGVREVHVPEQGDTYTL